MSNGKIDGVEIELMLTGEPSERDRYVLTTLAELRRTMATIAQHCRYCPDEAEAPKKPEDDRRVWAMWGVGRLVLCGIGIPLAVSAMSTVITLAITGKLGG
jgi:hypothetical protein